MTPGKAVADAIEIADATQAEFAAALGVSRLTVSQLVNGRRKITAAMAVRLEAVTGYPAAFWLYVQTQADLVEARHGLRKVVPKLKRLKRRGD